MNFSHKVIWITGASSGIGAELAKQLSEAGARLILSARRTEKLEALQANLLNRERIRILPLDVSHLDDIPQAAHTAIGYWGNVDILINNAGVSQRSSVEESDIADDQQIFDVNFFGNIALTRAVLPHMLGKKEGRIVVVSSVAGKLGPPFRSAYAASKHALHGWYDALRAEIADRGIQVHLVCPGYIRTDLSYFALAAGGKLHGKMDAGQADGMPVEKCARQILRAVARGKKEVIIGKEWIFVWIRKFFPGMYYRVLAQRAKKRKY